MLYITLLDQFHPGIYSSQVVDVCDYLNNKHKVNIRVLAFLSIRELMRSDAKIKLKRISPGAIVLPSFPGIKNFEWTSVLLFFVCLFTGERIAICRNVFCTKVALSVKRAGLLRKVVMDGRSAMTAEINEYDVFPVNYLRKNVEAFERKAVNESDYRIAVSEKLIEYWQTHFNYSGNDHVIIPCTLDRKFFSIKKYIVSDDKNKLLSQLGFNPDDIIFVYSGSTAPWQSFELVDKTLSPILIANPKVKVLFLSKESADLKTMSEKFNGRIKIMWLDHKDVLSYLKCCDYGILLREQSDTNKVASPVKFAEYLYAGLNVIISENIGDFSEFVITQKCGFVIGKNSFDPVNISNIRPAEKERCFNLALEYFSKESDLNERKYEKLVNYLNAG